MNTKGMSIEETLNTINDYLLEKEESNEKTVLVQKRMQEESLNGEKLRHSLSAANQVSNELEKEISELRDQIDQLPYNNSNSLNAHHNKDLRKKLSKLEREFDRIEERREILGRKLIQHKRKMDDFRGVRRLVNQD